MLVIENALYFDGRAEPAQPRHLLIAEGVVKKVSSSPIEEPEAERIDASGKWVMPGFLDTHTHYDAELLAAPGLRESVRHGVSTVLIGSCSLSTIYSSPEDCADFFSRVEALPHDQVHNTLRKYKTWETPAQYIEALEGRALGPNVMAFAGHSDMRVKVMGLGRAVDPKERPSAAEQSEMEAMLEDALDQGLLGMSSMTNPWDKVGGERFRSRHLPSSYATWSEYRRFNKILRKRERILQSAPNITTKLNIFLFFAASAAFGFRKRLKTALITAADVKANKLLVRGVLGITSVVNRLLRGEVRWQSVPMPFEVYADGMDLVVFEEFGAGEAALDLADQLQRNELLQDTAYRRQFRRDYEKKWSPRVWHRDFYDALIVEAPDESLVGSSFGQIADARKLHPVDAFLDLVVEHGTALRWKTTIANHRPRELERLLGHPSVQVSFADSGAHVRNMAFYNFPLYFLRMVKRAEEAGRPLMSIESAVAKLTSELATWYDVDAGCIAEGHRADIAIIDPEGLDESLDDYAEAPMECFDGLSRMVKRNDKAVVATIIGGRIAYRRDQVTKDEGFAADFGTTQRYGSFLRAGIKTSAPGASTPTRADAA